MRVASNAPVRITLALVEYPLQTSFAMVRKFVFASLMAGAVALALSAPASARGWRVTGPNGGSITHWSGWGGHWGCCWGGRVVAGIAVGTAVGVAATRPLVAPPVVYVAPPVVYPPPVVYVPPYYPGAYYVP